MQKEGSRMETENAKEIAIRNDAFRSGGGEIMLTPGIRGLDDLHALLEVVRHFDQFTEDNDPYHEHDFGSLEWHGVGIFWKIDYYDQALKYGEDALSPNCRRVLTVMLASEY
jgi:hypothetical protein